jgi:hypothetical protein
VAVTTGSFALWFVGPTPLERVRTWAGQVLQPGHPGAWECVSTEPLPRVGHHASVTLARTTWRLGRATLVQVIAEEGGNPRDGAGFRLEVDASADGQRVSLRASSWEPDPEQLRLQLEGFSAEAFSEARRLAVTLLGRDQSWQPVVAAKNAVTLRALGANALAATVAREGLGRPIPGARPDEVVLRRVLAAVEPTPENVADLLRADLSDARLLQVAGGQLALPGWSPADAARLVPFTTPWHHDGPWRQHPWWSAGASVEGWFSLSVPDSIGASPGRPVDDALDRKSVV